jgi:hypothetical protein
MQSDNRDPREIFCDGDGVLVECLKSSLKLHGRYDLAADPTYPQTYDWEIDTGLSHKEFWSRIEMEGPQWWRDLPFTSFGERLIDVLNNTGLPWSVATKVVGANCCHGKYDWAKRVLPANVPIHMTTDKSRFSGLGKLLIDDSEENTIAWEKRGGDAILVPTTYNSNRTVTIPPLDFIRLEIQRLGYMASADIESNEGHVAIGIQNVLRTLPQNSADRKAAPILSGVIDYFPLAMAAVARVSKAGNDQHNPGQPLNWARGKSTDHADCIVRHLIERGTIDTDGQRHAAKVAWRALALLQEELEAAAGWAPESKAA